MLVIDLKTSGKSHVATRGFILEELIGGESRLSSEILKHILYHYMRLTYIRLMHILLSKYIYFPQITQR